MGPGSDAGISGHLVAEGWVQAISLVTLESDLGLRPGWHQGGAKAESKFSLH